MIEMPCNNCLIFPLCQAQVNEFIDSFETPPVENKLFLAYKEILTKKCDLIYRWMAYEDYTNEGYQGVHYGFIIRQMSKVYKHEFKG